MTQEMYLIRHGETEFNVEGKFQGQSNSPLTENGKDQIYQVARMLKMELGDDIHNWEIISSPLGRAMDSTKILCETLAYDLTKVQTDERLAEVSVGDWAGLYIEDIKAQWPRLLEGTNHYNWYFNSLGGERYADVEGRVKAFLESVKDKEKLIVVAHGVTSRIIRGLYQNLNKDEALSLEVAHETFFKLADGDVKRYTYEYEEF
ncbi:fructose-2,6-bisphosphatase [Kurthia sp. 3B1D]|uniref:Fructose-2,6-bisphosphatase n=1 Tax=Candidatus Kurthia intestinigallinarum TaxID=1562256 RepID=A0A433RR62_9BACL|nr:histidine phosphatase family protein [Kurthia sp. 3B1D]RUS53248.1 fructose-2,6-bisphosphatase [Kurthia sp. 3B1D]